MTLYQVWHWKGCVTCCCRTWTEWSLNIRRHFKLAPSPQHLKQGKRKSREKKGKRLKLATCKNRRKRACLIFRSLGGVPLAEDFEPDIFGFPQLETVDCEILHLFTAKTDKAACLRDLCRANCFGREAQVIVWDFFTLGRMNLQLSYRTVSKYKWNGWFGTSYVFSWIWPCNGYKNYRNFMIQINSFARKIW